MSLFGIKSSFGGGSLNVDHGEGAGKKDDTTLHSSCRQLTEAFPQHEASVRAMFRRRTHQPRIPLVVHCEEPCAKLSSYPAIEKHKTSTGFANISINEEQTNKLKEYPTQCLKLLESDCYEDNRAGIERLVIVVNQELVNSKKKGSVAESLIFHAEQDQFSTRIRAIFPSFFTDEFLFRKGSSIQRQLKTKKESETQESQSTDETSLYSDLSDDTRKRHRRSLKLPALRVFISCLELASRQRRKKSVDLSHSFWKCILTYMVDSLEEANIERIECALCVKGFRLLIKLDPESFAPYVKAAVCSMIKSAKAYGLAEGDKMLVRECDRFLAASS
jgi:hypothetical protein